MNPSVYTAEEVMQQTFTAYELIALQRLEMSLATAAIPLGPKMTQCKEWLETLLAQSTDPTPRPASEFPATPPSYSAASAEATAALLVTPKQSEGGNPSVPSV